MCVEVVWSICQEEDMLLSVLPYFLLIALSFQSMAYTEFELSVQILP